jgi:hypothetical protein
MMSEKRKTKSDKRRPWAAMLFVSLSFSFFVSRFSFAQSETTQSASSPPPPASSRDDFPTRLRAAATQPAGEARLRQWFTDLTDTNVVVRERARVALMGLNIDGLGMLRDIVDSNRPLAPAQAAALHDVVIHVYIASTEPDRMPLLRKSGFLGVLLEPVQSGFDINLVPPPGRLPPDENRIDGAPPPAPDNQAEVVFRPPGGVLIKETWAGFAGFRFLRVGDVVVGTSGDQPTRGPTVQELRAAVQATAPGRSLDLQILRQGRIMEIPVNVGPRPTWAEDEPTTRMMQSRRVRRAELYWQFAFAPLLLQDGGML